MVLASPWSSRCPCSSVTLRPSEGTFQRSSGWRWWHWSPLRSMLGTSSKRWWRASARTPMSLSGSASCVYTGRRFPASGTRWGHRRACSWYGLLARARVTDAVDGVPFGSTGGRWVHHPTDQHTLRVRLWVPGELWPSGYHSSDRQVCFHQSVGWRSPSRNTLLRYFFQTFVLYLISIICTQISVFSTPNIWKHDGYVCGWKCLKYTTYLLLL